MGFVHKLIEWVYLWLTATKHTAVPCLEVMLLFSPQGLAGLSQVYHSLDQCFFFLRWNIHNRYVGIVGMDWGHMKGRNHWLYYILQLRSIWDLYQDVTLLCNILLGAPRRRAYWIYQCLLKWSKAYATIFTTTVIGNVKMKQKSENIFGKIYSYRYGRNTLL